MPGLRPCATMLGIGGWSPGYQAAGPKSSRICAWVKARLLPERCISVGSSGDGAAAGSGVAPGPGGAVKPYAHDGGALAAFSWCGGVAAIAAARRTANIEAHMQFLISLQLSPHPVRRGARVGSFAQGTAN